MPFGNSKSFSGFLENNVIVVMRPFEPSMAPDSKGNYQGRNFGPSGTQLRARSNFGLGFALTHILIKSDDSHRRKSIFDLAVADFDLAAAD